MQEPGWNVRVSATGRDTATAFIRGNTVSIGVPLQFDEEYADVTALEHFLAAVGADLVNGMKAVSRRRRVEVAEIEALVSCRLNNPLTFIGVVGEEGHPGIEQLTVSAYVSSVEPEETVREAWAETLEKSPLFNSFKNAFDLKVEMKIVM